MKVKYAAALGAALLSVTTGCTSAEKPADKRATAAPLQVAGTVALVGQHVDFAPQSSRNDCVGTGAFADVKDGAQVRIRGRSGQTLAMTRLGTGIANTSSTDLAAGFCDFIFHASVPSGQGSYTIEVINHADQTFTEKQMATPHLSLG